MDITQLFMQASLLLVDVTQLFVGALQPQSWYKPVPSPPPPIPRLREPPLPPVHLMHAKPLRQTQTTSCEPRVRTICQTSPWPRAGQPPVLHLKPPPVRLMLANPRTHPQGTQMCSTMRKMHSKLGSITQPVAQIKNPHRIAMIWHLRCGLYCGGFVNNS